MWDFDLIVIGAGPGGAYLAEHAALAGIKTAVITKFSEAGGTCLNRGCIPTKSLLASSSLFYAVKHADNLGLDCKNPSFDWSKIQQHKNSVVDKLQKGILQSLKKSGAVIIDDWAQVYKDKTVKTKKGNETYKAPKICLAAGSVPVVPSFVPSNRNLFMTSDEALNLETLPETMLIVGGGVLGIEFAQIFNDLGCKVCVAEMASQILPGLDSAVSKRLLPVFRKSGIEILLGKGVEALSQQDEKVCAKINGEERIFDKALIAIGRKPNLGFLAETDLDLKISEGRIFTDCNFQTSCSGIYAIGDLIAGPMLAHKAVCDAKCLLSYIKSEKFEPSDYRFIPGCVYTHPEIAWSGMSEDRLKDSGLEYVTGRSMFSANGKAVSSGASEGQIKVMMSKERRILGAVIWGPEASVLLSELEIFMALDIDCCNFYKVVHAHPTLSEAVAEAVYDALSKL